MLLHHTSLHLTLVIDESNDRNQEKNRAVVVRVIEETGVKNRFIGLPTRIQPTAEKVFKDGSEELGKKVLPLCLHMKNISLSHCLH